LVFCFLIALSSFSSSAAYIIFSFPHLNRAEKAPFAITQKNKTLLVVLLAVRLVGLARKVQTQNLPTVNSTGPFAVEKTALGSWPSSLSRVAPLT
jgi:hypothetical protein